MTSELMFQGLGKVYAGSAALDAVTLRCPPGRLTAILGPSGSGKSTMLLIAAGLIRPDVGVVRLDGVDITGVPADRRGFGLVLQSYALFPHLTVLENAAFGLRCRGVGRGERQRLAMAALERLGIAPLAGRGVRHLSGGEQQRVALARAIAFTPPVLLLDEPFAALDAPLRAGLRSELRQLIAELGVTTLLVTHDQAEALEVGDHLAILRAGRLAQVGVPAEVYAQPSDAFVASFLGAANLLPGTGVNGHAVDTVLGRFLVARPPPAGDCWAMVRPEDLLLVGADDGGFPARCEQTTHLGNRLRMLVSAGASRLTVELPNDARISAGQIVHLRPKDGRTVALPRHTDEEPPR